MATNKVYKMDNGTLLLSTDSVCKVFGITRQALNKWEKEGCPKAERGWWNISEIVNWKINKEIGQLRKDNEMTDKDRKLYYDANLKAAQSEAAELKTAIMRGEYLERKVIEEELIRFMVVFKRSVLAIPRTIAIEIAPFVEQSQARTIESSLSDNITKILESFSVGNFDGK